MKFCEGLSIRGDVMRKTALLIDGGHVRAIAQRVGLQYDPNFIENFAHGCIDKEQEDLRRILYYDCPQYRGKHTLPVSGEAMVFRSSDKWLDELASRDLFAIRRGNLVFRGWVPRNVPVTGRALTDDDFRPNFEQKGVDMRVGLDIASMADQRIVERIVLVSADTDMIPAMKHARKAGLHVVGVQMPRPIAEALAPRFLAHCDYCRQVDLLTAGDSKDVEATFQAE
jgi:uncharacterized LabA/DUF88 family protein